MRNLSSSRAGSSSKVPCLGCYMAVCFKPQNKTLPFGLSFRLLIKHCQECVSLRGRCCSDKSFPHVFVSPSQSLCVAAGFKDEADVVLKRGWKMPCGRAGSVCSRPAPGAGSGSDAALGLVWLYPWTCNGQVTKLCTIRTQGRLGQSSCAGHKALGSHQHLPLNPAPCGSLKPKPAVFSRILE